MDWKEQIANNIKKSDKHPITHFSVKDKTISYKGDIVLHEKISELKQEEIVRAHLVYKLTHELGYESKYIELEKEYTYKTMGRKKNEDKKGYLDLILKDESGNPYLFVEIKEPNEYENGQKDIRLLA